MDTHGLAAGSDAVCRVKAKYVNGWGPHSRHNIYNIPSPQPVGLETPQMSFTNGQVSVSWTTLGADLWCKEPGQPDYTRRQTLGLNEYIMAGTCNEQYQCYLQAPNVCWLKDTFSQLAVLTPPCPPKFTPECVMQPKCVDIGGQQTDVVHVTCSSPDIDSGIVINNYNFELMTNTQYANGDNMYSSYPCGDGSSAPDCLIPMTDLAVHPYNLNDMQTVNARVTATPAYGSAQTGNCQGDVRVDLPPTAVAMTATQDSNKVKVCWKNPFASPRVNNKINLHWSTSENAIGSTDESAFDASYDVTDVADECLTIAIKGGSTTFMAVASTDCPVVKSVITVKLTDCPTCHHSSDDSGSHGSHAHP